MLSIFCDQNNLYERTMNLYEARKNQRITFSFQVRKILLTVKTEDWMFIKSSTQ